MTRTHEQRLGLSFEVLEGLSVGDALGEALSYNHYRVRDLDDFSAFKPGTVRYTDDTAMALVIWRALAMHGSIDSDQLAYSFAMEYLVSPDRGYGRMARRILEEIGAGGNWEQLSPSAFGSGSFGNGAAMRVGPLGAYFASDIESIPEQAAASARVTHFHPEGIAGAIAVALAVATAVESRGMDPTTCNERIWDSVLTLTPESEVRRRLSECKGELDHFAVARMVGNGAEISAQDTVPFCIWNACRCIDDYREAFFSTVEVGGDCDTNAAIVGSIVTAFSGVSGIPEDWHRVRESLPISPPTKSDKPC